jgi:hypothetical protein
MRRDKDIVECARCHHFSTREDFLKHEGYPRCGNTCVL